MPAGGCPPSEHEPDARGPWCVPTTAIPLLEARRAFCGRPSELLSPQSTIGSLDRPRLGTVPPRFLAIDSHRVAGRDSFLVSGRSAPTASSVKDSNLIHIPYFYAHNNTPCAIGEPFERIHAQDGRWVRQHYVLPYRMSIGWTYRRRLCHPSRARYTARSRQNDHGWL